MDTESSGPLGLDTRVLVLGTARMADALGNSFLIVVLPLYVASGTVHSGILGGVSEPLVAGLVLALFGLVSSAAQPLAGRMSDRAGRRKAFVLVGLLVFGVANASFALVESYTGLLAVRALQGVAAAFTITAGVALVSELSTIASRGTNMGVYNALRLIGFGTGPLIAGIVVEAGPYRLPGLDVAPVDGFTASFAVAALAAAVSAVLVWIYVEDPERTRPTSGRMALRVRARASDRTLDPIFALGVATFVMAGCIALLAPIEPQINVRLDQTAFLFAVEFSTLIAALAVFQPLLGRASDRAGRKLFVVAGMIGLAPTTLAQGFVTEPWQMILARLLQGVSAAAVFAPGLALAGDLAEEGQAGAQLSVLTVSFGLGISLAQIASGYLVRYGLPAPFVAGTVMAALAVAVVQTQVVDAPARRRPERADRRSQGEPRAPEG